MSVINQVLSDLEKRGATALQGDADTRAVPQRHKRHAPGLIAGGVVLGIVAAGLWWSEQKKIPSPPPPPVAAPISTAPPLVEPPAAAPISAAPPPVEPLAGVIPQPPQAGDGGAAVPDMRPSFELSAKAPPAITEQRPNKTAARTAQSKAAVVVAPVPPGSTPGSMDKQMKRFSIQQQADNEFRKASGLMQQGRNKEALDGFEAALQLDAGHEAARQAMVGLLLDAARNAEAEAILQQGLQLNPGHSGFAMLLARLQVERNDMPLALETLRKTLPYAERQADYQAFVAALLQRQGHHQEAIVHYQIAVQLTPNSGVWLMGMGISLQAEQRKDEARAAFRRAIESQTLSAELQAFVVQRLKEL